MTSTQQHANEIIQKFAQPIKVLIFWTPTTKVGSANQVQDRI